MSKLTYTILKNRERVYIRAYTLLCVILLIVGGLYTFQKYRLYTQYQEILKVNESLINELQKEVIDEKTVYEKERAKFENLQNDIEENLKTIFPESDDYTNLTRQFDLIEQDLSKRNNPFEVSSIQYQTVVKGDGYSILPLRMNIKASRENFEKFLHKIENSGSVSQRIRLMDITSIRLNFEKPREVEGARGPEIINFTVQINAYFR